MEQKTMDRRIRKTRKQLLCALLELMKTKSIHEISVRELSDLADINRGTFYLHYRDPYDMLRKLENEFLEGFEKILDLPIAQNPIDFFRGVFDCIEKNEELAHIVTGLHGDMAFLESLVIIIKNKYIDKWLRQIGYSNSDKYEYFCSFVVHGFISLISDWLKNGMVESSDEMAKFSADLILKGMHAIKE